MQGRFPKSGARVLTPLYLQHGGRCCCIARAQFWSTKAHHPGGGTRGSKTNLACANRELTQPTSAGREGGLDPRRPPAGRQRRRERSRSRAPRRATSRWRRPLHGSIKSAGRRAGGELSSPVQREQSRAEQSSAEAVQGGPRPIGHATTEGQCREAQNQPRGVAKICAALTLETKI